jgi:hypothetical protein
MMTDPLLAPMNDTQHTKVGGVAIDVGRAGAARVKRVVYPAGFRWSTHMKSTVGTELCMHAHVGFLARGRVHVEYADGVVVEFSHRRWRSIPDRGWVVGDEDAVLIEFD